MLAPESSKNLIINSLFAMFADLYVRKDATFADLHSYTHTYCSFILLNEAIPIVSCSHSAHALFIWFVVMDTIYKLQVKRYSYS